MPHTSSKNWETSKFTRPFQHFLERMNSPGQALAPTSTANLFDEIPKLWESQKYIDLAETHVDGYGDRMKGIIASGGAPTFK